MRILVAYATRYGTTAGIAERIAATLTGRGHRAEARPVAAVRELTGYEGFVIGSAVYLGHWRKEATEFVERHRAILSDGRPVWLFSSGPLRTEATEAEDFDAQKDTEPTEIAGFRDAVPVRDHRVFFGALDPAGLRLRDRMIRAMPAGRDMLPEGDFREWDEIDAWATRIAHELAGATSP